MSDLVGSPGVLKFSIQITRKATGKVEEYELTSEPLSEEQAKSIIEAQTKEYNDGSNSLNSK